MEKFKVEAPTRADLAGGTLDLWPLYCLTGGAKTINVALDLTQTVHFEVAPGAFRVEIRTPSGEAFFFEKIPPLEEIRKLSRAVQFPVAVVAHYLSQKDELPDRVFRLAIESKVPVGSGLGGSSSLCVAIVRGLARLFNDFVDQGWQWKMLDWVKDMEAAFLRTPTGTQDYLAALFGGLNCFTFQTGGIGRQPYPDEVFEELSERMLILFSGEMHQSGLSNWELFKGALENSEPILRGMNEIARVANELDSELRVGTLNWKYIGHCLSEEWRVRKTLFKVETKRLEEILGFLNQRKVYGAKVCGAAQGGSLIALVPPDLKNALAQECRAAGIQVLPCRATGRGAFAG
jgi:D-glycero-alpha-D-manno-heptose-7-phosphate kinase